jgi:EAL and modified HD-GYP domain-containing signal transduction protein
MPFPEPLPLSRLMMEVNRENPDFAAVERLLKTDLTLSYKIMRYVRNMLFKSHGIIQADNLTLKEMLMYLGAKNPAVCCGGRPFKYGAFGISELYHLSMVRGKFCELIAEK